MRLSRTATFWTVVAAYLMLMISASTPSPLYVVYQAEWHFPTSTLTVIFGVYAVALLGSLLTVGGLSDFVGRRPVVLGGVALLAVAMVVFASAQGVAWLYVARVLQGLAAGSLIGTLSAGILDLAPEGKMRLATTLNALIPSIGLGTGALIAGAFAEWAPNPTVSVYVFVAAALLVLLALFLGTAGPDGRRPGAAASLVPRVRIASDVRGRFVRATPALFAPWAQMGLVLSLLVSLAALRFGVTDRFQDGLLVVVVCIAGTVSGFVLRDTLPVRASNLGAGALIVGVAITLLGVRASTLPVFVAGSLVSGLGLGALMSGSIRSLAALPAPNDRGEFFAGVYVVGYLAFSVPAVIAGFASTHFGLVDVTYVYGLGVAVLALAVLVQSVPVPSLRRAPQPVRAEVGCGD